MKNITIIIPTRNRLERLSLVLTSIPKLNNIDTVVVCDGDEFTFQSIKNWPVKRMLVGEHVGAVKCRNLAIKACGFDGILYATDDIVFENSSIESAFASFNRKFPDDDGVVGFVQNYESHPTGVALVGQKFLQRYPDKQLFFPGYFHFAAQEIFRFCNHLGGKFYQEKEAKIRHYHPAFEKKLIDQTHKDARKYKKQDLELSSKRKEVNKIWPLN